MTDHNKPTDGQGRGSETAFENLSLLHVNIPRSTIGTNAPSESEYDTCTFFLVKDCKNVAELRAEILQGVGTSSSHEEGTTTRTEHTLPEVALIDAKMIPSPLVVKAAAAKALQQYHSPQKLKSRSLHSELVYCLSGSKHIAKSLADFGIRDDSQHIIVAIVNPSDDDLRVLMRRVQGTCIVDEAAMYAELANICDIQTVVKKYKISANEIQLGKEDGDDDIYGEAVVARIAARDCM